MTGNHITAKLTTSQIATNAAVAADITYLGAAAPAPVIRSGGKTHLAPSATALRGEVGNGEEGEYSDWAEANPAPSEQEIWLMTQLECNTYVTTVNDGLAGNIEVCDDDVSMSDND